MIKPWHTTKRSLLVPAPALWFALAAWRRSERERVALKARLREMEAVTDDESLLYAEALRLGLGIDSYANLEPNWDSYGAVPTTAAAIHTAKQLVHVPTVNGGVQYELHHGGSEVGFGIDEHGYIVEVFFVAGRGNWQHGQDGCSVRPADLRPLDSEEATP